ncbi:MAG TPA: hypothetical protein VF045_03685 [Acidimicrobiales bacterium]
MRLRRLWPPLAVLLLGACANTPTRRPTPEELAEWEAKADRVVVFSVVWEVAAAALLVLSVWTFARYVQGAPPPWPRSVTVLMAICTALMLWPSLVFLPLWSA